MILHIRFVDGSNPWVSFPADPKTLIKAWKRWSKNPAARPDFMCNGLHCLPVAGGGWAVGRYFDGAHKTRYFERLGNALRYMERSGVQH